MLSYFQTRNVTNAMEKKKKVYKKSGPAGEFLGNSLYIQCTLFQLGTVLCLALEGI